MKTLIALIFVIYTTSGYAGEKERCIRDEVKTNRLACAKMEYQFHSKRLIRALEKLMDTKGINQKNLKMQQRKWLEYRERTCPKTGNETFWQSCLARITERRANKMEEKARKQ